MAQTYDPITAPTNWGYSNNATWAGSSSNITAMPITFVSSPHVFAVPEPQEETPVEWLRRRVDEVRWRTA